MTVKSNLDAKIFLALLTRLQTMSGGYDIVQPGATYPTSADKAFIVVQDIRFDPEARFVGADTENENRGLFALSIMTPINWTHTQQLGIAGMIRDHFSKAAKYTYDDVTVVILDTPSYVGNSRRDESFNRLDAQFRWRASG